MAINFNWITIFVNDMAASQTFYGDYLGLTKVEEFPAGPDMTIAFFQADNGMKVELIENRAAEAAGKNPDVIIGVAVDNFDELMEKAMLKAYGNTIRYLLEYDLLIHPNCIHGYNQLAAKYKRKK